MKIKQDEIVDTLRSFVAASRPNRFIAQKGHKAAQEYLENRIKQKDPFLGTKSTLQWQEFSPDFDLAKKMYNDDFNQQIKGKIPPTDPRYKKWDNFTKATIKILDNLKGVKGKNLVWEKKGILSPDEVIVVGAHYDTIAHDPETKMPSTQGQMPGADDNGSGVSIALGLIEFLASYDLPKTLQVVFFDFQELGFLGSRAFVMDNKERWSKQKFAGLINLEMLGHDSKKGGPIKTEGDMRVYIRKESESGANKDKILAQTLIDYSKKMGVPVRFEIVANSMNSADQLYFWQEGLSALMFSQNWEEDFNQNRYHTSNDFIETLNLKTFASTWRAIIGAITSFLYDLS